MENRYTMNMNSLSKEENEKLGNCHVCIVGCGGIGGNVIELLSRLGIGNITIIDGDKFEITNLNRQLLSNHKNLNKFKAFEGKKRIFLVNKDINVTAINTYVDSTNAKIILKSHNVIIDACDNIKTRLLLEKTCNILNIPLVHGAVNGWYGQVSTIFPGDNILKKLYNSINEEHIGSYLGCLAFAPMLVASIQVSETLKLLLNRGQILHKEILYIDLLENEYHSYKVE